MKRETPEVTLPADRGKRSRAFPIRELVYVPVGVLVYALTLHIVYANLVAGRFDFLIYRYHDPLPGFVALSWIAVISIAIALPKRIIHPSSLVLWILFLVAVAPGMLMSGYVGFLSDVQAFQTTLLLGAAFMLVVLGTKRRAPIRSLRLHLTPAVFWIVIGVFSLATYGLMTVTMGLSLSFVSILDVYAVRHEYATKLGGVGILGYLVSTQANVINPLIIARGIYSKRWWLVILGVLGQALLYSGTGFKTILFSVPALIVMALLFRRNLRPNSLMLLWGATLLMAGAAVIDWLQHSKIWTSLFSRRMIITPGVLTVIYVAFFSENPKAMLGYSVLRSWVDYPYEFAPPRVIGEWVKGNTTTAMNANLFADGFANFGWAGMFGAAILLLVYLRILDRAAFGLPGAVSALVLLMPTIALSNASILTSMFSHGLVVAVVCLAIAPRGGWGLQKGRRVSLRALYARLSRRKAGRAENAS